jgi:hypothetical protein
MTRDLVVGCLLIVKVPHKVQIKYLTCETLVHLHLIDHRLWLYVLSRSPIKLFSLDVCSWMLMSVPECTIPILETPVVYIRWYSTARKPRLWPLVRMLRDFLVVVCYLLVATGAAGSGAGVSISRYPLLLLLVTSSSSLCKLDSQKGRQNLRVEMTRWRVLQIEP